MAVRVLGVTTSPYPVYTSQGYELKILFNMAMDNMRIRPLGHEIIEISDDSEDEDDDIIEVAALLPRQVQAGQPNRYDNPIPLDWNSDNDTPMQNYRPRNDQHQLGFLPHPPRAPPQPDPAPRVVPVVQLPQYDPLANPFVNPNPPPVHQQGFKRKRSQSPLDRQPEKRPGLADRDPGLYLNNQPQDRLERERERRMLQADILDGGFGEPINAGPILDAPMDNAAAAELPGFSKSDCLQGILAVFPYMLPDHVSVLWDTKEEHRSVEGLVNLIIQEIDAGRPYPKIRNEAPGIMLKQKQASEIVNDPAKRYSAPDRPHPDPQYLTESRLWIGCDFPTMTKKFIDTQLAANGWFIYPAYLACYESERKWTKEQPQYKKLVKARSMQVHLMPANLDIALNGGLNTPAPIAAMMQEFSDARTAKRRLKAQYEREEELERIERQNEEAARAAGTIDECGCCFAEYPLNRMVHCSNEASLHFFCKTCANTNAETEVGQGKYVLVCMSMNGCSAGFSREQRDIFMDAKLKIALERIETEHNLRMAGIENLESCPFCPYAAEYPPIAETKIFSCVHPDCELESCRLCKKVSHIPKSCQEFAKESGADSHRRRLEDAMSEALVRKCNKCKTPFIKMDGCNKITCTKCRNVQCYICSQDCVPGPTGSSYAHFNDPTRGGKEGHCQLFDNTEQRHQEQVDAAQKEAMAKIQAEHPEYTEEELKATIAETTAAKEDRENRARADPMAARYALAGYGAVGDFEAFVNERMARRGRGRGGEGGGGGGGGVWPDPYRAEAYWRRLGQPLPPQPLPGLGIPRSHRGDAPAYPGILPDWVVYGEAPPPPVPAYNVDGEPAPLAGIRIHEWGPARQPFVVQPPLPPPAPVNAIENERKLAQDRALREAYKNAPPQVQARRRDQMRRMMKDPDLDDATVERAILQVGEFAEVVEIGGAVGATRAEIARARGMLDRLQGRDESLPPRRPTPSAPRPLGNHPVNHLALFGDDVDEDGLFLARNYQENRDLNPEPPAVPDGQVRRIPGIMNDPDGVLFQAERLVNEALQQIIAAPAPAGNGHGQRPPEDLNVEINRMLDDIHGAENQPGRAAAQAAGDGPIDRRWAPYENLDLLPMGLDSDDDSEDEVDLNQQLRQAQLDLDEERQLLGERGQAAQPPPVPRLLPVRQRYNAAHLGRGDQAAINQYIAAQRPRYIPSPPKAYINYMPPGPGNVGAPAARPAANANVYRPRFDDLYPPLLDPRANPNPHVGLPLYVPPPVGNRTPGQQLRDEIAARAEIDRAEVGDKGMAARLRGRLRGLIARNERALANNDPDPDRLREDYEGYRQRQQDALRDEREGRAIQMRMDEEAANRARNEARRLRENMRRAVGMPGLADGAGAPVRPRHLPLVPPRRHDEARRLNEVIAEGEARMLNQRGAQGMFNMQQAMWPRMPRRVEGQYGREVILDARPPPANVDEDEVLKRRSEEALQSFQRLGLRRMVEPGEVRDVLPRHNVNLISDRQARVRFDPQERIIAQPRMREDLLDADPEDLAMMDALVPAVLPAPPPTPRPQSMRGGHQQRAAPYRNARADPATPPPPAPVAHRQSPLNPEARPFQPGEVGAIFQRMGEQLPSSPSNARRRERQAPVEGIEAAGAEDEVWPMDELPGGFSPLQGTSGAADSGPEISSSPPVRWQRVRPQPSSSQAQQPEPQTEPENEDWEQSGCGRRRNANRPQISDDEERGLVS